MKRHEFDPDWVVRPGALLAEEMDANGLTVGMVAQMCRVETTVIDGILTGEQPITAPIAAGLSRMGISEQFWLNFERIYREGLAAGKKDV